MNSHPQCVKDEYGCGYPEWLSTSLRSRFLVHRLSRCYPLLIHGLSTILWIKGFSGELAGGDDQRYTKDGDLIVAGAAFGGREREERGLLLFCDREEAVEAKGGDEGGPERCQPVARP